MVNPAMQGMAWDWDRFPVWVGNMAIRHLRSFLLTDKQIERDWDVIVWWVTHYGSLEAREILKVTDVCRWSKYVV